MTVIKCKMCGGDMELSPDKRVGTCEYCGCTMTLPKVDSQQRAAAFDRGNHFRRIGEFDKALAVYERIIQEEEDDAEAHWCCALCRFGIEYVKDPASGEYLPTCHRASFDSFLDDVDYQAALAHADPIARRQYEKDGEQIANVQRGILSTVQKEAPFDVFICYKETDDQGRRTVDSTLAQDIYYQLTEQGHRVFFARITLEEKAGLEYEPYIFAALHSAKVMVAVGTRPEYLNAVWVKNEWSRYLALMKQDRKRLLIPCYRDMDPYDLPEQLSVLQSYDMSKIGFIQDLIRGISKVLDADKQPALVKETVMVQNESGGNLSALIKRGNIALEDKEWSKADEFFDRVLDIDAECAEAYFGKLLAARQKSNRAEWVAFEKNTHRTERGKRITACLVDEEFVSKAEAELEIPGYFGASEIWEAFAEFDRTFESMEDARNSEWKTKQAELLADKLLSRAVKYAKGDLAEQLTKTQEEILTVYQARVKEGRQQDAREKDQLTRKYDAFLESTYKKLKEQHDQTDKQLLERYEEAEAELEKEYEQSPVFLKKAISDLEKTAEKFQALEPYRDSAQRAEECKQKAVLFQNAITEMQLSERYEDAKAELEKEYGNNDPKVLKKAAANLEKTAEKFQELGSYRDSAQQVEACKQKAGFLKKEARKRQAAKRKKVAIAIGAAAVAMVAAFFVTRDLVIPWFHYRAAENLLEAGQYQAAGIAFGKIGNYKDAQERKWESLKCDTISAGDSHTVGLQSDGTVIAVGSNSEGQCNVSGWRDTVAISAGWSHTVGLKSGGTVVAVGNNDEGQCNVSGWSDIVAISAGRNHTVGLKSDGTVVAVGRHDGGQCSVEDWSNIVAVSAGYKHTIGLKSDGTVVAVGRHDGGQCSVEDWSNIVAVSAGYKHTIGLKSDGTVVAVGDSSYGRCNVEDWSDIVAISAGNSHTIGLKSDGTVVAVGYNFDGQCNVGSWSNIVAISAGSWHTVGLKSDGTVVAVGDNDEGQCNVKVWSGIKVPSKGELNR